MKDKTINTEGISLHLWALSAVHFDIFTDLFSLFLLVPSACMFFYPILLMLVIGWGSLGVHVLILCCTCSECNTLNYMRCQVFSEVHPTHTHTGTHTHIAYSQLHSCLSKPLTSGTSLPKTVQHNSSCYTCRQHAYFLTSSLSRLFSTYSNLSLQPSDYFNSRKAVAQGHLQC